jgi:hypothetical protein
MQSEGEGNGRMDRLGRIRGRAQSFPEIVRFTLIQPADVV